MPFLTTTWEQRKLGELNGNCHASLLFAGVSIASVARRLGHSSMTTTQKTYLHIIQKLEKKNRLLLN